MGEYNRERQRGQREYLAWYSDGLTLLLIY